MSKIWKSIILTQLRIQECKKFPNTYSVYMVRLDTPINAFIANMLITFRPILKIMFRVRISKTKLICKCFRADQGKSLAAAKKFFGFVNHFMKNVN